ncbi:MAG: hypothetical protein KTR30_30420, partial [Saprospiraceae bacterium]|nr:hypothetical protein [Saprospiraceae bacterium]
ASMSIEWVIIVKFKIADHRELQEWVYFKANGAKRTDFHPISLLRDTNLLKKFYNVGRLTKDL